MKYSRQVLIQAILQCRNDFLQFVDYINAKGGALEFPEVYYIKFYQEIGKEKGQSPKRKSELDYLKSQLVLQNMLDASIFTYQDKASGTLAMSKVIYELLVFVDSSRNKQLSLAKFESLRAQMVQICSNIKNSSVGSDDHNENLQIFWELISEVLTIFKENINVLNMKVDEIAGLYKRLDIGDPDININQLYDLTQTLYERHILPCLEFISPNMEMIGTLTFRQAVDQLYTTFDSQGDTPTAIAIYYKLKAITSYYKDIEKVSDRLVSYLHNLSHQRKQFMAIEHNYKKLMDEVSELRHGNLRKGKKLALDNAALKDITCFDGLSALNQSFSARFDRKPETVSLQFKYYYEQMLDKPIKKKVRMASAPRNRDRKSDRRAENIMFLVSKIPTNIDIDDVDNYVDSFLRAELTDFTLLDTLYGLEFYMPLLKRGAISQTLECGRLEDDNNYLEYAKLNYAGA